MQRPWDSNYDSISGFYKGCLLGLSVYDLYILLKPIITFVLFRGQYNPHLAKKKETKNTNAATFFLGS